MKRIIAVVITISLLFTCFCFGVVADNETIPEGYLEINSAIDLYFIRNDLSGKYILTSNIDLTDALSYGGDLYNESEGWVAIGYNKVSPEAFTGIIDGNGHCITGLVSKGLGSGLVYCNEGTICNLSVSGEITQTDKYAGTICCENYGIILNCFSSASITSKSLDLREESASIGGIVGYNDKGATVAQCGYSGSVVNQYNSISSNYPENAGGIVGRNAGLISCCYNCGTVTCKTEGIPNVGGVVGATTTNSRIENCYNTGSVSGTYKVGGIAGSAGGSLTINCCYNVGELFSDTGSQYCFGIVGSFHTSATMSNCYYLNNVNRGTDRSSLDTAIMCTSAMMKNQRNYKNFDFDSIWMCIEGNYPIFIYQHKHSYKTINATDASCESAGYSGDVICPTCGKIFEVGTVIPALGHDFGEWTLTTVPTCSAKGIETRYCSRCDATETREIALLDHNYSYYVSASPTEKDFGVLTGVCECGAEVSITLPKLNETDYTYVVTEAATCISEGSATYTWNNTQYGAYSFAVTLTKDSGDHKCTPVVVAPTCTEQGYSYYKCEYCERIIGDYTDYLPALGHDYVDGVCTRCGDREQIVKENPFVDLSEGAVYYDAILWAYYHTPQQITGGFTATEFRPQNPCTRAQVVTFLWRAKGCPEPTTTDNPFSDVSAKQANGKDNPYYKAILWAAEEGITTGYAGGLFKPNDTVTRAQFVTFLWRADGKPATSGSINGFADAGQIASPYQQAVAWAVEKGITTGYEDNTFRPNAACTRWAVVLFMYRDMA